MPTDEGARYDKEVSIDAGALEPMITYGTNPGMGIRINDRVPDPARISDPLWPGHATVRFRDVLRRLSPRLASTSATC